jgi:hypothetical protein
MVLTKLPETMAISDSGAVIDKRRVRLKLKSETIRIVPLKASRRLVSIPARASPLDIDDG